MPPLYMAGFHDGLEAGTKIEADVCQWCGFRNDIVPCTQYNFGRCVNYVTGIEAENKRRDALTTSVVCDEATVLAKFSTVGLKRGELSEATKRAQLWDIKIRGKEADEVIQMLYPAPEATK